MILGRENYLINIMVITLNYNDNMVLLRFMLVCLGRVVT